MYNRWITYSDELYHYGVLGMKWGVHKARSAAKTMRKMDEQRKLINASNEPALLKKRAMSIADENYSKAEKKRSKALEKIDRKATRKLQKINTKYEKRQAKADRKFDKAERKANALLSSKKSAERAFRKASKAQFKANKVAARGKKWYERMEKEYKRADISMSKRNQEIGKELIRQVRANSRAMYAATYVRG